MALSHPESKDLTERVIGAAIEVHRELGPGLLESTYEECLCMELQTAGLAFVYQPYLPVRYKGRMIRATYRPDIVVEKMIVVEIKSVEKLAPIHKAQLITYVRHSHLNVGLLFNFNSDLLKNGMLRISI